MTNLAALEALLAALPHEQRAQIERELRARATAPPPPPERRRVDQLGALREMLRDREPPRGLDYPTIPQREYMKRRPNDAPTDEALVKQFGAWIYACRAAASLGEEGQWVGAVTGRAHARANKDIGLRRSPPYTREEILRSIRQCASETGVAAPTSTTYDRWVIRKRGEARRHGKVERIPRAQQIYRLYPVSAGGYNAALAEAVHDTSPARRR